METAASPQKPHAQRKRKSVDEGHPEPKKPVQKRASAACGSCRARKVRCDVLLKSTPCTNCRLDRTDCVIAESKRTKFARTANGTTYQLGPQKKDGAGKVIETQKPVPNKEVVEAPRAERIERGNGKHSYFLYLRLSFPLLVTFNVSGHCKILP